MQPSRPSDAGGAAPPALEFLKRVGLIVGAAVGVVLVAALALGQFHALGLSNLLFLAALVVLGMAAVPALSDIASGFSALSRSLAKRDLNLRAMAAEKHEQRDKWLNRSVLFGAAGFIIFVLSFLVAAVFPGP